MVLLYVCILKRKKFVILFFWFVDYNLNVVDKDVNMVLFYVIIVGDFLIVKMIVKKLKYYGLSVDMLNNKGEILFIYVLKIGYG